MKPTEHMRIDSRALVGLNLLEDPSQPGHSVFDILNRTRTAGGCRLLKSWLKQPLIQVSAFLLVFWLHTGSWCPCTCVSASQHDAAYINRRCLIILA
jgi:hypothetical protein